MAYGLAASVWTCSCLPTADETCPAVLSLPVPAIQPVSRVGVSSGRRGRTPFAKSITLRPLDDYVYVVESTRWEASLKELADECPELKDNRIALARVKAVYESGQSHREWKSPTPMTSTNPSGKIISKSWRKTGNPVMASRLRPTWILPMRLVAVSGGNCVVSSLHCLTLGKSNRLWAARPLLTKNASTWTRAWFSSSARIPRRLLRTPSSTG